MSSRKTAGRRGTTKKRAQRATSNVFAMFNQVIYFLLSPLSLLLFPLFGVAASIEADEFSLIVISIPIPQYYLSYFASSIDSVVPS